MTTKSIITQSGKTITVDIEHKVTDKIAYADGYNDKIGREIADYSRISILDANRKCLATAEKIGKVYPRTDAKAIAAGAVAQINGAYLKKDMYDLIAGLVAEVEAETPKSDEYLAIVAAKAQAEKDHDTWYNSSEARATRKLERDMDSDDSDN